MKTTHLVGVVGALVLGALVGPSALGQAQQTPPPVPMVDAKNLIMQPEQAQAGGRVLGDSTKAGMYVVRNRFVKGTGSRPHYHDHDRYVTVLKGTWWTGTGDVYKPETMVPIREGGFMFHPAGYHHYDGAKDEDVIVQIIGMGPVQTVRTEVDEKGQPVPAAR
jgi:quercetin dioxygenase-like cupin family protein